MQRHAPDRLHENLAHCVEDRGLAFASARWIALKGGRTNWVWRTSGPEGDVVVKLYAGATRNPLFPNDPQSEALVLRHLQPHVIAPRLLDHFATDFGQCLIYEHVIGDTWSSNTAAVAHVLHRLHRITPPGTLRRTPDGSAALQRQTEQILELCPGQDTEDIEALRPRNPVAASGAAHLLHADPVPANLIGHEHQIRLIDWQCPAIGDPCEDIAIFLSPAMHLTYRGRVLGHAETSGFLNAYPDRDLVTRYRELAPWYHWRMAAYCLWTEKRGDPRAAAARQGEINALRSFLSEQQ